MALRGFQRTFLRGLAHSLQPVVHVGHEGASDAVAEALDEALTAHELIKVRMRQPADKRELAQHLATSASAQLCGLVGHTAILYRPHPTSPRLQLPERAGPSRTLPRALPEPRPTGTRRQS
ncbi:MAG: YhbY family RNA-binding protein [Proteobacteria bacterium]|nr:YhbY family RNA-binding protein [Pseudomonadota bacterium]